MRIKQAGPRKEATMNRLLLLYLVVMFILVQPAQAESIYRCKENGKTVLSDFPCEGAETIKTPELNATRPAAPQGAWQEVSRRVNNIQVTDPQKGTRLDREIEVVIECLPSKIKQSVFIQKDAGIIYLRDGKDETDPKTGKTLRKVGSRFGTFDEAAKAACTQP